MDLNLIPELKETDTIEIVGKYPVILNGFQINNMLVDKKNIKKIIDLYELLKDNIQETDNICDIIVMKYQLENKKATIDN